MRSHTFAALAEIETLLTSLNAHLTGFFNHLVWGGRTLPPPASARDGRGGSKMDHVQANTITASNDGDAMAIIVRDLRIGEPNGSMRKIERFGALLDLAARLRAHMEDLRVAIDSQPEVYEENAWVNSEQITKLSHELTESHVHLQDCMPRHTGGRVVEAARVLFVLSCVNKSFRAMTAAQVQEGEGRNLPFQKLDFVAKLQAVLADAGGAQELVDIIKSDRDFRAPGTGCPML